MKLRNAWRYTNLEETFSLWKRGIQRTKAVAQARLQGEKRRTLPLCSRMYVLLEQERTTIQLINAVLPWYFQSADQRAKRAPAEVLTLERRTVWRRLCTSERGGLAGERTLHLGRDPASAARTAGRPRLLLEEHSPHIGQLHYKENLGKFSRILGF